MLYYILYILYVLRYIYICDYMYILQSLQKRKVSWLCPYRDRVFLNFELRVFLYFAFMFWAASSSADSLKRMVPALIVLLASNWRSSLPVSCFHPGHVLAPSIKIMCCIAHFCQAIRQVPSHCALFPMSPKLPVSTSPSETLKVWSSNREAEEDAGPQVPLTNPPKSRKVDPIWSIISLD